MITIAIVDNEMFFSNQLLLLLQDLADEYNFEMEIQILESAEKCLASEQTYDFYFVSVELSDLSGIELARRLRKRRINCELVLYSESDAEMRVAFFVRPCAFIRKGHLESDLREAFSALCYLFQNYSDSILLKDNKRSVDVNLKELIYLHSEGHYIQLFFQSGEKQVLRNTMRGLSEQLSHLGFIRIHVSYMVNRTFINEYEKGKLLLKNGVVLPVSKPYQSQMSEYRWMCKG